MPFSKKGLSFYDQEGRAVLPAPRGDVNAGAWFGSEVLKAATVEKMRQHREQDQIVQGLYQAGTLVGYGMGFSFKGCLVGCTLPPMNVEWYDAMLAEEGVGMGEFGGFHHLVERFYNIPAALAVCLDDVFEHQYEDDAPDFAVEALEAIPVGAVYSKKDIKQLRISFFGKENGTAKFLDLLRQPSRIVELENAS